MYRVSFVRALARQTGLFVAWLPVLVFINDHFFSIGMVEGESMQPTLNPHTNRLWNDWVLLWRWGLHRPDGTLAVERGQVVMVRINILNETSLYKYRSPVEPEGYLAKRVIAMEGDLVQTRSRANVRYIWIEGDEGFRSRDSNTYGAIPMALVEAEITHIIWPWWRIGRISRGSGRHVRIIDLLDASVFSIVKNDIKKNIKKIRDYMIKYPLQSETLESLVKSEAVQKKTVATEGLLWLIRSFAFASHALHRSMEDEKEELSTSFSKAYNMAIKNCPHRDVFYSNICSDSIRLRMFINEWLSGLDKIVFSLQNFYETGQYAQDMSHSISNSEVYSAVYSGVPVYEMICQGISVMRRRSNSYLNATQILKVAGIDKGKRTKILEKEILVGEHEKVQGGYGKYQGTWIPFERGVEFCRQYGVEQMLWPILSLDLSIDNQNNNTPTKEQALAFRRKQSFDLTDNKRELPKLKPSYATYPSSSSSVSTFNRTKISSPKNVDCVSMDHNNNLYYPTVYSNNQVLTLNNSKTNENGNMEESLKKHSEYFYRPLDPIMSPSVVRKDHPAFINMNMKMDNKPSEPLDQKNAYNFHRSKDILTSIFLDSDIQSVPSVLIATSSEDALDIDVPIDDLGHTALHWASALARLPLVASLISKGADPCRANFSGETSLIRAVLVTNNLDQSTFPELLEYIYPAIPLVDHQGRTVLHHISLTAGIKGRSSASCYYLETLLEWIVKGSENGCGLTLSSFVSKVVDFQDKNGDTALNIASRIGNRSIVQQLLDIGANATIPNKAGLRPLDFGIIGEIPTSFHISENPPPVVSDVVVQKSHSYIHEVLKTTVSTIDKEFNDEIHKKQLLIDSTYGLLRDATRTLAGLRKDLEDSRKRASCLADIQQKCKNIERAINEETLYFYNHHSDSSFKMKEILNTTNLFNEKVDPDAQFFVDISLAGIENEESPSFISIPVLSARIAAYQKNAKVLCALATSLRGRSSELEDKCRKVVSLCTGVEESKVDSLLEGLLQAVESDDHQGVDMVRLSGIPVPLNTIESLESAFRLIGLSDSKIQETLKNKKLSELLAQNILQSGVLDSGCTKTQGNLLYVLSTNGNLLKESGRNHICSGIMSNKFKTPLQVETAIRYALDKDDIFDSDLLDKISGVGITVSEKELQYEVHTYINNNRETIKNFGSKKLALVLSSLRQHPLLKWADQLMLKRCVEDELSLERLNNDEVGHTREDVLVCFSENKKKPYQQTTTVAKSVPNMFEEGFLARLHKPGENKQLHPKLMEDHLKHTKGRVVTRFPPEPNGYLHIGHSKAIAINFGYAKYHGGYCYLRYDDTNPESEEDIYVKSIEETIKWLGFEPYAITFSSDYFDELYRLAVLLIEKGKAYVCHCNDFEIKYGRGGEDHGPRIACKHRDRLISENLKGFNDMKNGVYKVSEAVLRMKQDLEDGNPQMWDLVAYRILDFPHHRTGTKWKIYPTYDFTHCLVDSLENISFGNALRRGVPPGAILSFVNELGVTTAVINIQVSRFENSVRKFLENITPRLMMVLDPIPVIIENLPFDHYEEIEIPYKMDDLKFGTHYVPFTSRIFIDRTDFRTEDSPNYYRLAPGKLVGLLKVPFPIRAISYTTDPVSGLVSQVKAVYETQNFEKPKIYIHWVAKTVNGDSPIHIDQVRIFKQLFNSEKPASHANEEEFLANINKNSECILRNTLIEKGFEELKQKQLKEHANIFENLEFESFRFQAIRIGYFCMDKDTTSEKTVLNQIVSLKEDKGKYLTNNVKNSRKKSSVMQKAVTKRSLLMNDQSDSFGQDVKNTNDTFFVDQNKKCQFKTDNTEKVSSEDISESTISDTICISEFPKGLTQNDFKHCSQCHLVPEKLLSIRKCLSRVLVVDFLFCIYEFYNLLRFLIPWTYGIFLPSYFGSYSGKIFYLPDISVFSSFESFWLPFLTWWLLAIFIPLIAAIIFNFHESKKGESSRIIDPMTFSVVKAIVTYSIFYKGFRKNLFFLNSIFIVKRAVGVELMFIISFIGVLYAMYDTSISRK
ncbi:hypothetical protein PMAC_000169 [Pneumocystis sp. 'macacae']|nr:hypothetical protein PMAC_000169 [Pneumocystis sp. 'macacae']